MSAARVFVEAGLDVIVFEKSRGVGGRSSVRRRPPFSFDHGAPYFTVQAPGFRTQVRDWEAAGVVAQWKGRVVRIDERGDVVDDAETRYVGVPGMNSMAKALGDGLEIATQTRVNRLVRAADKWVLFEETGRELGRFDFIVVALPPAQASDLLGTGGITDRLIECPRFNACWAVMLGFPHSLPVEFDGAHVQGSTLSRVARNNSKPQRLEGESWVLHADAEWSARNLERRPEEVITDLLQEFRRLAGLRRAEPIFCSGHRWRYALASLPIADGFILRNHDRLALCGDWCGGDRIESAFLSGRSAARAVLDRLGMTAGGAGAS